MTRDPKFSQVFFDANAFNRNEPPDGPKVDRLLRLSDDGAISMIMPHSVQTEINDSRTPRNVQRDAAAQIFTIQTDKNSEEIERARKILAVIQGNARPGKHDADAAHIAELFKYGGGYFITHDERLLKKQAELADVAPGVLIVTLERFLEIFDDYEAKRAQCADEGARNGKS